GYRTFSELLEDAQKEGVLDLEVDKRSRTYVVTRFGSESKGEAAPQGKKKKRRRSKKKAGQPAETHPAERVALETTPEEFNGLPPTEEAEAPEPVEAPHATRAEVEVAEPVFQEEPAVSPPPAPEEPAAEAPP